MLNLTEVCKRVEAWNAARYEREYDHALSMALLKEEYQELLDAETQVDELDALCDIIYVSLGILWKVNGDAEMQQHTSEQAAQDLQIMLDTQCMPPRYLAAAVLTATDKLSDYPIAYGVGILINICMIEMDLLGLTDEGKLAALLAVCASNDSKTVTKTDSSVKANIDKGAYYVPPTEALTTILHASTIK